MASETTIQIQVADYLVLHYPDVIFHSDFGSGVKLNKVQSALQKRLNGGRKSYPDMFIAHMRWMRPCDLMAWGYGVNFGGFTAGGLYLELKKDGTKLIRDKDARKILKGELKLRKKGDWWDQHIEEQALMLDKLRERGYIAEFAVGFDKAIEIINKYLGGHKDEKVEF